MMDPLARSDGQQQRLTLPLLIIIIVGIAIGVQSGECVSTASGSTLLGIIAGVAIVPFAVIILHILYILLIAFPIVMIYCWFSKTHPRDEFFDDPV